MAHWREVKDMIEDELEQCWFDMPIEIEASRAGIFFSGAGARGSTIGNMYYGIQDPKALAGLLIEGTLYSVLKDDLYGLEESKKLFIYTTEHKVRLLGSKSDPDHPGCDAAWLNLPNLWKFYLAVVEAFDSVTNKKDLKNLIWSWINYVNSIAYWFYLSFPWQIGQLMKERICSVEDAEGMLALARDADAYMKQ